MNVLVCVLKVPTSKSPLVNSFLLAISSPSLDDKSSTCTATLNFLALKVLSEVPGLSKSTLTYSVSASELTLCVSPISQINSIAFSSLIWSVS